MTSKQIPFKSEEGFTILELTIVIAIMGILAAVLVPSFTSLSRKAKIKADINTIKTIQAQIELYETENEGDLPGISSGKYEDLIEDNTLRKAVVDALISGKYIKKSDTIESKGEEIRLQAKNAQLAYDSSKAHFQLVLSDPRDTDHAEKMGEPDKAWIAAATPNP